MLSEMQMNSAEGLRLSSSTVKILEPGGRKTEARESLDDVDAIVGLHVLWRPKSMAGCV